jgi:hypothetical protein
MVMVSIMGALVLFFLSGIIKDQEVLNIFGLNALLVMVASYVSLSLIMYKLFDFKSDIKGAYERDLAHVGAIIRSTATFNKVSLLQADELLDKPVELPPSSKRILAFLSYGCSSIVKALHSDKTFILIEEDDFVHPLSAKQHLSLQILTYETIVISQKVIKSNKLNPTSNPIPYAAYLFRMASLHNNPKDKDVQEKALLLWQQCRSLSLSSEFRTHSLQTIQEFEGTPETWIREINNLK